MRARTRPLDMGRCEVHGKWKFIVGIGRNFMNRGAEVTVEVDY